MHVYRVLVVLLKNFWWEEEKLDDKGISGEDNMHGQPGDHYSKAWHNKVLANKKVVGANTCKAKKDSCGADSTLSELIRAYK